MNKKIVFLTGTRADFGKLKSLIKISENSKLFDVHVFVTGMHMNSKYGSTVDEIYKSGFKNIYKYINHDTVEHMDRTLAKTIDGFSHYISEIKPDLIIVHGDRVEALAGAIVGSLNNILVTHVEGGEVSGTIDELIRHAVSKMSHIHLVANDLAKKRLIQLGELEKSIHVIGSPDLDLMSPDNLPPLNDVKKYYSIDFDQYAIAMFHPVTTDYANIEKNINNFVEALKASKKNYIVIYPNNDLGSNEILQAYRQLEGNQNFRVFPSLRFEYFLTLLKESDFIIGNSSAGIREAPYYNIPTVDIGTRQLNRASLDSIFHSTYDFVDISEKIKLAESHKPKADVDSNHFGDGNSDQRFIEILKTKNFWDIDKQKQFQDLGHV